MNHGFKKENSLTGVSPFPWNKPSLFPRRSLWCADVQTARLPSAFPRAEQHAETHNSELGCGLRVRALACLPALPQKWKLTLCDFDLTCQLEAFPKCAGCLWQQIPQVQVMRGASPFALVELLWSFQIVYQEKWPALSYISARTHRLIRFFSRSLVRSPRPQRTIFPTTSLKCNLQKRNLGLAQTESVLGGIQSSLSSVFNAQIPQHFKDVYLSHVIFWNQGKKKKKDNYQEMARSEPTYSGWQVWNHSRDI